MTVAENIAFDGLVGAPQLVNYRAMRETARDALAKLGVDLTLARASRVCPFPADNWWRLRVRSLATRSSSSWTSPPPRLHRPRRTPVAVVRMLAGVRCRRGLREPSAAEVLDVSSRVTVLRDGRLVGVFDAAGMTQSRLTELMTGKRFYQLVTARDSARRRSLSKPPD